jgi:hypothetical protein
MPNENITIQIKSFAKKRIRQFINRRKSITRLTKLTHIHSSIPIPPTDLSGSLTSAHPLHPFILPTPPISTIPQPPTHQHHPHPPTTRIRTCKKAMAAACSFGCA